MYTTCVSRAQRLEEALRPLKLELQTGVNSDFLYFYILFVCLFVFIYLFIYLMEISREAILLCSSGLL